MFDLYRYVNCKSCSEDYVCGNRNGTPVVSLWLMCLQRKSREMFLKSFVSRCWEDHNIQYVDRRSEHHWRDCIPEWVQHSDTFKTGMPLVIQCQYVVMKSNFCATFFRIYIVINSILQCTDVMLMFNNYSPKLRWINININIHHFHRHWGE